MNVKVGSFVTGTINPGSTKAVTGVGFEPEAILFMMADPDADGSTDVDDRGVDLRFAFGFSANLEDRSIGVAHNDLTANTQSADIRNTRSIQNPITLAASQRMFVLSYDSDGFTVKTTTGWNTSVVIAYMAFAGAGVEADLYAQPGRAVGQTDETPFSFDPDFLLSIMSITYPDQANLSPALGFAIGAADAGAEYVAASYATDDGSSNSIGGNYIYGGEMWAEPSPGGSTQGRAALVNFITSGYRHDVLEALAGWSAVHVLGMKTGGVDVGEFLTQTSTGGFSITGVGFEPVGLMLVSLCSVESVQDTPITADAKLSIGFTDGTAQRCCGYNAEDSTNLPRSTCFYQKDGVYFNNGNVASGFVGIAEFVSFDSDGFTLDMTNADPAASFVYYVAFGPEEAAVPAQVMRLLA